MTLSLDTNVFVALIRGRDSMVRRLFGEATASGQPMFASLIVLHELLFGAECHARPAAQRESIALALSQVEVQPFDARDMAVAGQLRARLKRAGTPVGPCDVLIAGQALARGWTVVTANLKEFRRVDGLEVIDWGADAA